MLKKVYILLILISIVSLNYCGKKDNKTETPKQETPKQAETPKETPKPVEASPTELEFKGYKFQVPATWKTEKKEEMAIAGTSDGKMAVVVLVLPADKEEAAYAGLENHLKEAYKDLGKEEKNVMKIAEMPAVLYDNKGTQAATGQKFELTYGTIFNETKHEVIMLIGAVVEELPADTKKKYVDEAVAFIHSLKK